MNDELKNNQNNPAKPTDEVKVNNCTKCKKDPCVCTKKTKRTKPPEISWI